MNYVQVSSPEAKILWGLTCIVVAFLLCCCPVLVCQVFPAVCCCLKVFKLCGINCCADRLEARIKKLEGNINLRDMFKNRAGQGASVDLIMQSPTAPYF